MLDCLQVCGWTAFRLDYVGLLSGLRLDYILHQTQGNVGALGVYMSPFFLTRDVTAYNGVLQRLYKYPREGEYRCAGVR